jgi:hypothetical protein
LQRLYTRLLPQDREALKTSRLRNRLIAYNVFKEHTSKLEEERGERNETKKDIDKAYSV